MLPRKSQPQSGWLFSFSSPEGFRFKICGGFPAKADTQLSPENATDPAAKGIGGYTFMYGQYMVL